MSRLWVPGKGELSSVLCHLQAPGEHAHSRSSAIEEGGSVQRGKGVIDKLYQHLFYDSILYATDNLLPLKQDL